MGARYRYAIDRVDRLIAIEDLSREARRARAPYRCIGCGLELTPKLGPVVVHHFAHRQEQACSGETYLHRLAKLAFVENYRRCLAENQPFLFSVTRRQTCNHFQEEHGFSCSRPRTETLDLTRTFDVVELERECDGFRADVLLRSTQTQKRLFVDFVVTHQSSPEKRSSGIPIIEVEIENEDHAVQIAKEGISSSSSRVKLFNLKKYRPRDDCNGDCPMAVDVFLVHAGGKCVITSVAAGEATSPSYRPSALRKQILGRSSSVQSLDRPSLFRRKVREAYFEGLAVRNCFVCRHHGIGRFEEPIFCKEMKVGCESNAAASCARFTPFRSPEECAAAESRNLLYIETRQNQRFEEWQARTRQFRRRSSPAAAEAAQAREFVRREQEWKRGHSTPTAGETDEDT
jgi:hypothetical protein